MRAKILFVIILAAGLVSCVPPATALPAETSAPIVTPEPTATLVPTENPVTLTEAVGIARCGKSVVVSPGVRELTNEDYGVKVQYPASWECDDSGLTVFRYSSADGFLELIEETMMADNANIACETQAKQSIGKGQNEYGAKPTVEILQVGDQPACLVLPSADQPQGRNGLSLLVVEYPKLGKERTRLLLLFADKNHIRDLIDTLKFIN